MDRPLLLIDVDGVISLFGFDPTRLPAGRFEFVDGIAHFISATAGQSLRTLGRDFELIWCTGWEEKADEYLPHALGLPSGMPHLTFGRSVGRANTHWKLEAIDAYADPDRALAWVDDAHDERCRAWARARLGPTLLVRTEPAIGLNEVHVAQLVDWAREVRRPDDAA